jgi:cell wall integrity and stress response component
VTATPDPPHASGTIQPSPEKDKGIAGGSIAGIIVGVLAGLGFGAAVIFWWRRRRQKDLNEKVMASRGGSPAMMTVTTTGEGSAAGGSAGLDSRKRRSYLMPIDPRLDPFAKGIYIGDINRSRESFNSLQDNQDYSRRVHDPPRVLRAINPDPDNDD